MLFFIDTPFSPLFFFISLSCFTRAFKDSFGKKQRVRTPSRHGKYSFLLQFFYKN